MNGDLFRSGDVASPPVVMRALTVRQPWASLIIHGTKRIENRTSKPWASLMGRLIGIHAGLYVDGVHDRIAIRGYGLQERMPRGALLGVARITGTVTESDDEWFHGPIGIRLADVAAYERPITMRGAQGYWSVLDRMTAAERADIDSVADDLAQDGVPQDLAAWRALAMIDHNDLVKVPA